MSSDRWKNLDIWKLGDEIAFQIYVLTKNFPKEEIYGITSQIRRSALSVSTNIVEGYSRRGDKELAYFLNVSLGSLAETKYLLYFSHRLGYISSESCNQLDDQMELLGKKLWKFYDTVR
ncbi:MAG: four helix bundle protein [Thermodesulfobacteriota bacterium]